MIAWQRRRGVLAIAALLVSTSGCRVLVELVEADEAAPPDTRVVDPSCDTWSFSPAAVDPCGLPDPTGDLSLGDGTWTFDTNSGVLTDPAQDASLPTSVLITPPGGVETRAVSLDRLVVSAGAVLRVSGKRPLLIVSWSTAEIAGVIDATSRPGMPAAGADPDACAAAPAVRGGDNIEGGGGGGGGGFGTSGAPGGTGDDGLASAGGGGGATSSPVALRGGCSGAAGGNALAGAGGAGGGAVFVAAREQIDLNGAITAGGAGGGASQGGRAGGGGGGAGGYVGLASGSVVLGPGAVLAANGGGGGGGSDGSPALPGQDGQPSVTPATAGAGQGMGNGGGAGGALDVAPVAGGNARRGGGGGGGGVGWIVIDGADVAIDPSAILSPAPP